MATQLKCLISICILTLASSVFSQDEDKIPDNLKGSFEKAKSQEAVVEFYGKVVDQYGKPVVGAEVEASVEGTGINYVYEPRYVKLKILTDSEGKFFINPKQELKGHELFFDAIIRKGYVAEVPLPVFSCSKNKPQRHIPDPNNPVIFHMRKMGENPTYLMINRDFDFDMSSGEELVRSFIDLKYDWNETHEDGDYEKDFLAKHYDIKVSANFDKEKSDWTVTFTSSGEGGGFVLDDKFLGEAPEDGYKKEFIFVQHLKTREWDGGTVADNTEFKLKGKYLYVKSREPAIYTRIEFTDDYAYADFETFRINANTGTNPYGERNLEFNDELPLNLTDVLYGGVIDSFLVNKLPKNPDINKMFDEFKKTHKPKKNTDGYTEWVEINE